MNFKKLGILFIFILLFSSCKTDISSYNFNKDTAKTSLYFEKIKSSSNELRAFLKNMPKGGDLHNHVTGALYSDYLVDHAVSNNFYYNSATKKFEKNSERSFSRNISPLLAPKDFIEQKLYEILDIMSMRGKKGDLTNGHDHFFNTFSHISSAEPESEYIIANIAKRNISQNMDYLELMVQSIPKAIRIKYEKTMLGQGEFNLKYLQNYYNLLKKLDSEEDLELVKKYLDEREYYLNEHEVPAGRITIRYIQQLKRSSSSLEEFFAAAYYSIYFSLEEDRIVGVNMVQAEDHPNSRKNFDAQMKILNFLYNRFKSDYKNSINLSLHSGELVLKESPLEAMENRILGTLYLGSDKNDYDKNFDDKLDRPLTKRIGHGVSIAWEDRYYELIETMAKYRTAVEICLSSNEEILGVRGEDHPFMMYKDAGIPICISTDDEGVNRSNITNEYLKAVKNYKLKYTEIKDIVRNSIEYSFLPGESFFENGDYSKVRNEFKKYKTYGQLTVLLESNDIVKNNPKMKKQIELEREFIKFEKFMSDKKSRFAPN